MRKGIHPLMRTMRVVLRDGSSYSLPSVLNRPAAYILQTDTTNHPAWTGEKAGISTEDERMARIMRRFDGFVAENENSANKPEP